MKRLKNYIICVFLLIFCISGLLIVHIFKPSSLKVRNNSTNLKSIIQENNIDTFCSKVAEQINGPRIIMLGEQQHGDGETFSIKSKIINILNKKFDYNIMFIEGSYFYNQQLKNKINRSELLNDYDWDKALYKFWGKSNETKLLRNSFLSKDLDFYGIDYNFIVNGVLKDLSSFIDDHFMQYPNYYKDDYLELFETLDFKNGPLVLFNYLPKKPNQDKCLAQINKLKALILKDDSFKKNKIDVFLTLENLYQFYYSRTKIALSNRNAHRDSIMYKNIDFIISNLFQNNDKIIIWAANSHLMYNSNSSKYASMGSLLKTKYKEDVFNILFTSRKGITYNIATQKNNYINITSINSLEYNLNRNQKKYIYGNFDNKNQTVTNMKFLGHQNRTTNWFKTMDSYIYIDTMKPITF